MKLKDLTIQWDQIGQARVPESCAAFFRTLLSYQNPLNCHMGQFVFVGGVLLNSLLNPLHPPRPRRNPLIRNWESGKARFLNFLPESKAQFLNAWCLLLDAWCLMLDAWGLRLEAWCLLLDDWCLMLDAWCLMLEHLPDPSTKGSTKGALCGGGRRPPPFVDGSGRCSSIKQQAASKHQASSSKHQASSIKHQAIKHQNQASVLSPINTPRKLKHFWLDRSRSFFGARLFQILRFPDFQISNFENVEFGSFGIINPIQNRLVSIRTVFQSL